MGKLKHFKEVRRIKRNIQYVVLIISTIFFLVGLWATYNLILKGYFLNPLFILGVMIFGATYIFYSKLARLWFKYKPWSDILFILFFVVLFLARKYYQTYIMILSWGTSIFLICPIIAFLYMNVWKLKNSPSDPYLTISIITDDNLNIDVDAKQFFMPLKRYLLRGFNADYTLLTRIIKSLIEENKLIFYSYFEFPRGEWRFNSALIHLSNKNALIKKFTTGSGINPYKIRALSVDCTDSEKLEYLLGTYWIWDDPRGDYYCYISTYNGEFKEIAEKMDKILYSKKNLENIENLVKNSKFLIRNIKRESGKQKLEIITTKLSLNEIIRLMSKEYPIHYDPLQINS